MRGPRRASKRSRQQSPEAFIRPVHAASLPANKDATPVMAKCRDHQGDEVTRLAVASNLDPFASALADLVLEDLARPTRPK